MLRLLVSLIEGLVGIVGSFVVAMNSTQLATMADVTRCRLSRIGLALWRDVLETDDRKPRRQRRRGR